MFDGILNAPQERGRKRTCNPFPVFFVGVFSWLWATVKIDSHVEWYS